MAALLPFEGICWLQIVAAGWDGEGRERKGWGGQAATVEQNSVILSSLWEAPQGSSCRIEAVLSGLRLVQTWVHSKPRSL